MHRFAIRVRYGDTDQMGFAYYAHYLRWFEIGRTELLRDLGMSYASVERDLGVLLPVLTAHCDYKRSARYDDRVWIETAVAELKRASMRFAYRIVHEDGGLLAIGYTEHCFLSRDGRPVRMPVELQQLMDRAPRV
jgi:acyl-CoA thioester hydrolase